MLAVSEWKGSAWAEKPSGGGLALQEGFSVTIGEVSHFLNGSDEVAKA